MPKAIRVDVTHTTWVHPSGAVSTDDILKSVEDMADQFCGDIVVSFKWGPTKRVVKFHFDYDAEEWHDEEGHLLRSTGWEDTPDQDWKGWPDAE